MLVGFIPISLNLDNRAEAISCPGFNNFYAPSALAVIRWDGLRVAREGNWKQLSISLGWEEEL